MSALARPDAAPPAPTGRWVLACAAVAGDLTPDVVARLAGVGPREVEAALDAAAEAGLVLDGRLDPTAAAELVAELDTATRAELHATMARHLMAQGADRLADAAAHAREAGPLVDRRELVELAAGSGRVLVDGGDHAAGEHLLRLADELGADDDPGRRARRLLDLARAVDSQGRVPEARDLLAEVVRLADAAGDGDLVVRGAVASAFPADWYAGDRRTAALLQLAEERADSDAARAAVLAARALCEVRVPVPPHVDHQVAWITRAGVAQPLAAEALARTEGLHDDTRLVALLAWRSVHRSPAHLVQRLAVSEEAVDLAQRRLRPDRLVEAAVSWCVDALEAGDRRTYDRARALLRWTAERDGNPRLLWWSGTVAAGAALLDGDTAQAVALKAAATAHGQACSCPGWVAAELELQAEIALDDGRPEALAPFDVDDAPPLEHPIARATVALVAATLGNHERAEHHLRVALRLLDDESSLLLSANLAGRAAAVLGRADLVDAVWPHLEPWADRVAVDASAWWCHGPVALTLADMVHAVGRPGAPELLAQGEALARAMGDVRSVAWAHALRERLGVPAAAPGSGSPGARSPLTGLTDRERAVLALLPTGLTNAEIGRELSYSASTIRATTVALYRKLGVHGRPEAAAMAVASGLTAPPSR